MADLLDRYRLMRAKRRWMRPPSPPRYGASALVLALLAVAVVGVAIVERRGAAREAAIVEHAAANRTSPVAMVLDMARTRPVVVLGDVAGAGGPKRLAADVIGALARGPGLDWVALEIGSDMQPYIDRYLDAAEEDASALMARPRALRPAGGTAADYMGIYRRVRALNAELGVDRRIRIVAIDSPDWPPAGAVAPSRMLSQFAARDEHMMAVLMARIFDRDETARTFLFVDGLRALDAALRLAANADSAGAPLLTRRLRRGLATRVASVIVDAPGGAAGSAPVGYRASRLDQLLRTTAAGSALAFPLTPGFPGTMEDLDIRGPAGMDIVLSPQSAPLATVADGYVRLPN